MKKENLKELSPDDLLIRRDEALRDIVRLQLAAATGQLQNTSALRFARRRVARLNTELRQREIAGGLVKNALTGRSAPKIAAND